MVLHRCPALAICSCFLQLRFVCAAEGPVVSRSVDTVFGRVSLVSCQPMRWLEQRERQLVAMRILYSVEIVCQGRRVSTVDCAQMVPGMIAKGDREARCTWHLHGQAAGLLLANEEVAGAAVRRGLHGKLLRLNTPLGFPGWAWGMILILWNLQQRQMVLGGLTHLGLLIY